MTLQPDELLAVYRHLGRIFPEDLHIARPLIQRLQTAGDPEGARELALAMARRMLAAGQPGRALTFLEMCRLLEHPDKTEIDNLTNIARITDAGLTEIEQRHEGVFALFEGLGDSEAAEFLQQGTLQRIPARQDIVRQGEASNSFYLILEGDVDVHMQTATGESKQLNVLHPGDFFGEFACVYQLPRSATVTSTAPALLLEFPEAAISQLMRRSPLAGERLLRTVQSRMIYSMSISHAAFAELPETDRRWLAEESFVHTYQAHETVAELHGDEAWVWVVLHGQAGYPDNGTQRKLGVGDMFGTADPIGLPAGTRITATRYCLVCKMPRRIFNAFVHAYPGFEVWLKPSGKAAAHAARAALEGWRPQG